MKNTHITQTGFASDDGLALQYLVRAPQATALKNKAIILLHGVGSNEEDLFGLAHILPPLFYVIAARAPITLGTGSFAWYQVDFSTGKPVYNADQEASSRELISNFIGQVKQKYQLDEVYLGGFSQGAIMSYSIGLTQPADVHGIIALSGRILEEIKPLIRKVDYLQQLKVFIAHGQQDQVLPIHYAKEAKSYLEKLELAVTYYEYAIDHQISNEVLQDLNEWLN